MPSLPPEFADLQPFAEQWCLATEPERYEKRLGTPMPDLLALYDAVAPRAEAAMVYCDQFPYPDLPDDALNLLHLLYSMIMISFPVEAWGQQRVPDTGSASFDCFVEPIP
jgi:hypothetical protein